METPWFEFATVAASVIFTLAVGLYFSRDGKRSIQEYMLGNKQMSCLPITLSIVATFLTGNALMSSAQETYLYGTQPILAAPMYVGVGLYAFMYLPVLRNIESASIFEFFDRRFNSGVRKYASIVYVLEVIHHTAMSQYIPALALSQATGYPAFTIACILSVICLLYTATGGLKAVAWADSCQAIIFAVCTFILLLVGLVFTGGPSEIWRKTKEGYRLELLNFDPSPYLRHSVLTFALGSAILGINFPLSPSFCQRIASLPTKTQAKRAIIWSVLFSAVFIFLAYAIGIIVYTYLAGCDPLLAGQIRSHSQILPYFVSRISKIVPGIFGVFLASVIAAGLSTTTSCWNTVACTIYEDFFRPKMINAAKETTFRILMATVIIVSIVSTSAILLLENLGSLLEATLTLKAMTTTTNFVLYNSGMFLPWVTSKGVIAGSLSSNAITAYIIIGVQRMKKQKLVVQLPKILTTFACHSFNDTALQSVNGTLQIGSTGYGTVKIADPEVLPMFKLSMMLYMVPGAILGLIIAFLVSWITGFQNLSKLDRKMILPFMHWALPPQKSTGEEKERPLESQYELVPQSDVPTMRLSLEK